MDPVEVPEDLMLLEFSVEKMVEEADIDVKFEGDEPRAYGDFIASDRRVG